jgi:hypothetical protein
MKITTHREFYPNGYGVSVICHETSYGLELAVLKGDANTAEICYDTPITDNVIGYCTAEQLAEIVKDVRALPSCIGIEEVIAIRTDHLDRGFQHMQMYAEELVEKGEI